MYKTIVLLALSQKLNQLCVAGVELNTGRWIRIVSDNANTEYAVAVEDTVYEDGSYAAVGDIIRVKIKRPVPLYYQPENYEFDPSCYWTKCGRMNSREIYSTFPLHNGLIFFNADRRVTPEVIQRTPTCDRYSLALVQPEQPITLSVSQYENRRKYRMTFKFRNFVYQNIPVTDQVFCQALSTLNVGNYCLPLNLLFVMSLGAPFKYDNMHYKLIAQVFIL